MGLYLKGPFTPFSEGERLQKDQKVSPGPGLTRDNHPCPFRAETAGGGVARRSQESSSGRGSAGLPEHDPSGPGDDGRARRLTAGNAIRGAETSGDAPQGRTQIALGLRGPSLPFLAQSFEPGGRVTGLFPHLRSEPATALALPEPTHGRRGPL